MNEDPPQDSSTELPPQIPKSTNNGPGMNIESMKRLSLSTATATELPPSSPASAPLDRVLSENLPPSPARLRKSPSSASLGSNSRAATPTLRKKSSMNSVKGTQTPPRSPLLRRKSSNLALSTQSPAEEAPPPLPLTEASVARDFFKNDVESHQVLTPQSDLVVIIHDACYGHRYSRPRTTKSTLMTIVERPERILATVLGVSAAYVRLGGRHLGGEHMPRPDYSSESIPFKIQKSSRFVPLVSPAVTNVHGTKWMNELKIMCEGAEAKLAVGGKETDRPNLALGGTDEERPELHSGDLYLCSESLNALEGALGGVFDAVDAVFDSTGPNRAFVAIRPPGHHCSDNYPSGFCWINNVHAGISHASSVHGLTHAAIIDFDLHHGDGSQTITWDHNEKVSRLPKNAAFSKRTSIGYFSLHDINSYPCEWGDKEKVQNASLCIENAHGQNIWNVHLQPWRTDADFWKLYETRYMTLLEKTRAFLQTQRDRLQASSNAPEPRAAIFISAGFDASEWEGHGMQRHKVNVPTDFYARFTKDINDLADEEGLGVNGRVISVLEGGYSDRALTSGVLSHVSGMARQTTQAATRDVPLNGLAQEMGQRLGSLSIDDDPKPQLLKSYDPNWWSPSSLEDLENLVNPPPPAAPRKPKGPANPTYTTPTQSFVAKVVPVARRSMSGSLAAAAAQRPIVVPAPPEVNWVTAAHELSKILTPDRQTKSCKPEDLNAKATEARRNRQSVDTTLEQAPVEDGKRMQLRGRKAKAPTSEAGSRPSSRASRRTTIGGVEGATENASALKQKAPRRRVSVASTIVSALDESNDTAPAIPGGGTRRESSSSIVRPSSAASNRSNLVVDKTRTKPRSPAKPKVPKKTAGVTRPPVSRTVSSTSQTSKASSGPKAAVQKNVDIDSLSSGVKKMSIKLNVPPKEEYNARETKSNVPKVPRKIPTATKPIKKPGQTALGSAGLPSVAEGEPSLPKVLPEPSKPSSVPTSTNYPGLPQSRLPVQQDISQVSTSQTVPQVPAPQPVLAPSLNDNVNRETQPVMEDIKHIQGKENVPTQVAPPSFLPPEPTSIPAPSLEGSMVDNRELVGATVQSDAQDDAGVTANGQPLFPGASATPKHSRQDLPVFTSTSPIPFGQPTGGMYQALASEAKAHPEIVRSSAPDQKHTKSNTASDDIWAVPETPRQT